MPGTDSRARWTSRLLLALVVASYVTAGCSGGGSSGSARPSTTAPASTASTSATGGASGGSAAPTESNPPGDIPDNQVFVPYHKPGARFSVVVPEGWSRTAHGSAVVFTDKYNSVRIEQTAAKSAPTAASAQSKDPAMLSAKYHHFHLVSATSVKRKSGNGVLVKFTADSPVDPVTGRVAVEDVQRYEFWHRGTLAVLTLSGPRGADNVDPWRKVTDSLHWTA